MRLGRRGLAAGLAMLPAIAAVHAADLHEPDRGSEGYVTELGLAQIAGALRKGDLQAEQYVWLLLRRIRRASGLNAFITVFEEQALEAARLVDLARLRGEPLPPYAGVPTVAKDNIDFAGKPTTAGTPALRHSVPSKTAPVLQALLSNGMILLGKTNMHELALGITSSNSAYGFVLNPYDTIRIPGGSSGGTAAAIAARLAPGGLGTDTGGSLRIPAAFCGISTLRPSVGNGGADRHYPLSGIAPISSTRDTPGPMARTVEDVAILDALLRGERPPRRAALKGIRLGVPRSFWENLDAEVERVCSTALRRLRDAGVTIVEADLGDALSLDDQASFPLALYELGQALPAYLREIGSTLTYDEVVSQVASPDVQGVVVAAAGVPRDAYLNALGVLRPKLQTLYAEYFRARGVEGVIFPTTPIPAPRVDPMFSGAIAINGIPQPGGSSAEFNTVRRNTDPASVAGIPAIALPAGCTRDGLPVGLEIDGPVGSDTRLLEIGMAVEAVLGRLPSPF